MKAKGLVFAASIISNISKLNFGKIFANSFTNAMFTSLKIFSINFVASAVSIDDTVVTSDTMNWEYIVLANSVLFLSIPPMILLILSNEKTILHFSFILSCLFFRTQNLVDIIFFYYQNKIRTQ